MCHYVITVSYAHISIAIREMIVPGYVCVYMGMFVLFNSIDLVRGYM